MSALVQEWLNLLVRWIHVLAAILWIGDSFLFMWLDSHLSSPSRPRDGDVSGELWMVHSGGFYEVIKRKSLAKDELPPQLYWFKWESYSTWLSGFLLLIIVFHLNGASMLVDPSVMALTGWQAVLISLGILPVAFGLYELLWQTPLAKDQRAFAGVGLLLVAGLAYGLTHVFSARGAFLQVGATLGTIMAANVFFRIIPAQQRMLASTRAGTKVDTRYGLRAKGRSIQNHYLTLPVLFAMLSNHFPSTYGSAQPWLVLTLLIVFGVGLKYFMIRRKEMPALALAGTLAALVAVGVLTRPPQVEEPVLRAYKVKPPVSFATVNAIVELRCLTCHAEHPVNAMFAAPPMGITLDSPENLSRHADRVFIRAVLTKTMPLGNLTAMTEGERELIGAWYAQGADIHAPGPVQTPMAPVSLTPGMPGSQVTRVALAKADPKAQAYFTTVCAQCHGEAGAGDGPAAGALEPRPPSFADPAWQKRVSDAELEAIILGGGPSVGKSPLMPPNPALQGEPETVDGLVKLVRSFGSK
jgi:uncharacterized membrane protein